MVRTSPDSGRTVDHLYSFTLDRFRALDHWSGPQGALFGCRGSWYCWVFGKGTNHSDGSVVVHKGVVVYGFTFE